MTILKYTYKHFCLIASLYIMSQVFKVDMHEKKKNPQANAFCGCVWGTVLWG